MESDYRELVDELADMLGPDATPEQRLAARIILVQRQTLDELQLCRRARADSDATQLAVKTSIDLFTKRPTLATVFLSMQGTSVGRAFVRVGEYAMISVLSLLIAWAAGALQVPADSLPPTPTAHEAGR